MTYHESADDHDITGYVCCEKPRLRKPIRSTMPAITLSKVESHCSDREGVGAVCDSPPSARVAVACTVDMAGSFISKDFFT